MTADSWSKLKQASKSPRVWRCVEDWCWKQPQDALLLLVTACFGGCPSVAFDSNSALICLIIASIQTAVLWSPQALLQTCQAFMQFRWAWPAKSQSLKSPRSYLDVLYVSFIAKANVLRIQWQRYLFVGISPHSVYWKAGNQKMGKAFATEEMQNKSIKCIKMS